MGQRGTIKFSSKSESRGTFVNVAQYGIVLRRENRRTDHSNVCITATDYDFNVQAVM